MPIPVFDAAQPKSLTQDAALAVDVLRRFKEVLAPFTTGDACRVIDVLEALFAESERLMHVIDRDRYVVAYCLGAIETAVRGREWLLEGRGPYEWDDDRYREEFGDAIGAIREASQPLKIVAWDKSDCTRIEERVNAAKLAAHELLANPGAPREMIATELWGVMNGWPIGAEFKVGDRVQKKGKASWRGKVVGWYRTELTELGYAVESAFEPGSVQIYPATALVAWDGRS